MPIELARNFLHITAAYLCRCVTAMGLLAASTLRLIWGGKRTVRCDWILLRAQCANHLHVCLSDDDLQTAAQVAFRPKVNLPGIAYLVHGILKPCAIWPKSVL